MMSRAALSVFVWGIYMLLMGAVFLVVPNAALPLFGYEPTDEIWIRVVAIFALVLGYFYVQTARHEMRRFFRWKVEGHIFGVVCMVSFVVLRLAPPALLILAAADLLAALWTALALRHPASAPPRTA